MESKCKAPWCNLPGEWRGRFDGYCSLEHRDYHEYELEVEELQQKIDSLTIENKHVWGDYLRLHEAIRKHRDEHLGACCTEDDKLLWSHINVKH